MSIRQSLRSGIREAINSPVTDQPGTPIILPGLNVDVGNPGGLEALNADVGNPGGLEPIAVDVGVVVPRPVVILNPASQTVDEGDPVSFVAAATGADSQQWYKDGSPLPGETSPTLTFFGAMESDEGAYFCRFTNAGGNTDTTSAILTVDPVSAIYDLDSALANWPLPYAGNEPAKPTLPNITAAPLTATNDSEVTRYLGNTDGDYNGRVITIANQANGGPAQYGDVFTLAGADKEIIFQDGVDIGRIQFANQDADRIYAHYDKENGTARNHQIGWFGPFWSASTSAGYNDILIEGLHIDISVRFPTFAGNGGAGWVDSNRIATINTYLGHFGYGNVPERTLDYILANCFIQRTADPFIGGTYTGVRTQASSRTLVCDNKIDQTFQIGSTSTTALRMHQGDGSGAPVTEYCVAINNAMQGQAGAMQFRQDDSEDFDLPLETDRIENVWLENNSYTRLANNFGAATLGDFNNGDWISEGVPSPPNRAAPYNLTMLNNKSYNNGGGGGGSAPWPEQTDDFVTPVDWFSLGNQSNVPIPPEGTEYDNWVFQPS